MRVSFTDDVGHSETLTSAATAVMAPPPNIPATGAPTVSGTAQVGQTLTAVTTGIMDANGLTSPGYTYRWVRVNGTDADIPGAISSAYTLVADDEGKTIKVRVSFTDDAGYSETLTSGPTTAAAVPEKIQMQSGNDKPTAIWSPDGNILWVGQEGSSQVYAYNFSDGSANTGENWDFTNPASGDKNIKPTGIWSNDTHIYVTDADVGRVFQYNRSDKSLTSNDYSLHTDNGEPRGIWSDGTTVWVSDRNGLKLYAYQLSDFSRDSGKDITQSGVQVHCYGIWSDGVFMWLLEQNSSGTSRKKLEARALSDWSLQPGLEVLGAHDNLDYRSLWSDGTTMYVAETTGTPRVRNFPMPANIPGPPTGRSGSVLLSNTGQTGSNTDLNFYDKA